MSYDLHVRRFNHNVFYPVIIWSLALVLLTTSPAHSFSSCDDSNQSFSIDDLELINRPPNSIKRSSKPKKIGRTKNKNNEAPTSTEKKDRSPTATEVIARTNSEIKIGIIGDLNGSECQARYPRNSVEAMKTLLKNHDPDHVISPGDLIHGECLDKKIKLRNYRSVVDQMWRTFQSQFLSPALRRTLPSGEGASFAASPGNHDAPNYKNYGKSHRPKLKHEFERYARFWKNNESQLGVERLKLEGVIDNFPYYWAYKKSNILFIVLQSTQSGRLTNSKNQKKYLKALLAHSEAKSARMKIVYGHFPAYPILNRNKNRKGKVMSFLRNEIVGKKDGLVDLLIDSDVDYLITGHSHSAYPGELTRNSDGKKLKIISMPCAHAPRYLQGQSKRSARGFAILNIDQNNKVKLSFRHWKSGNELPLNTFPKQIKLYESMGIPKGSVTYKRLSDQLYGLNPSR